METNTNSFVKIIIEGPGGSGKSCLLRRYIENQFPSITTFLDFCVKNIIFHNLPYKLQIWDPPRNRFMLDRRISPFYKNTSGLILTVDSENGTLKDIENQFNKIRSNVEEKVAIILACTKSDLWPNINQEELKKFADDKKSKLVFCSAKTGEGVEEVFLTLFGEIILKNNIWKEKEFEGVKLKLKEFIDKKKTSSCF